MSGLRNACLFAAVAVVLAGGCAESDPAAERAATAAAEPWLALMDAEEYERCWDVAAPLFRDTESRETWVTKAVGYREPLGAFKSREPNVTRIFRNPWGAPQGIYATVVYDSYWQNGTIFETVNMQQQADGNWLVAGYAVRQQR